jgi:hypothetical protein
MMDFASKIPGVGDEQKRRHAMSQLRAARELYSETGERAYLAVIDAHLRTVAEVDARRRIAEARRAALLELRQHSKEGAEGEIGSGQALIEEGGREGLMEGSRGIVIPLKRHGGEG